MTQAKCTHNHHALVDLEESLFYRCFLPAPSQAKCFLHNVSAEVTWLHCFPGALLQCFCHLQNICVSECDIICGIVSVASCTKHWGGQIRGSVVLLYYTRANIICGFVTNTKYIICGVVSITNDMLIAPRLLLYCDNRNHKLSPSLQLALP